jgi:RNA polymerase subunit RPABC4/transcription elongation factor Spt4
VFDDLLRDLRRLEKPQRLRVSMPSDEEGYFDRECPSPECLFAFKVHEDDWRDKVRDEEVICPFCGHTADSGQWLTQDQLEHAKKAAIAHMRQRIGHAMRRDAENWNRRQSRDSFIRITLRVNNRPQAVLLPAAAADSMRLKITCPACSCRYAVIGAAFFCPACGHNSAELLFTQSIVIVRNALAALAAVRAGISERDTAEATARLIVESGLQNTVTAFQRYAEALYARQPSAPAARRNAFQNLAEGNALWRAAFGKQYGDHLDSGELAVLTRMFQQRHLLAHRQGLVDENYITRSGDTSYRIGQRVVVREAAVHECLFLIEKLAASLAADVRGTAGV